MHFLFLETNDSMKINLFKNLNRVLSAKDRISSVDIWRGIAILSVVLFHFDKTLPYGSLGVDLFFVISGLLVGGLLTKPFLKGESINFFNFFLRRGFKIWPSYYSFLIIGTLLATLCYNAENANQIIPFSDFKRYLLFYQNYTGKPFHISFDHIWSLCVEEHFYILLPLLLICLQLLKAKWKLLFSSLILVIILGFVFKVLVLYFTNGKDTYSATHNRIDALAWGVLLNLIIIQFGTRIKSFKWLQLFTLLGIVGLFLTLYIDSQTASIFYHKVLLHTLVPIFCFFLILGTYYTDFSRLKVIRIMGYYSYNWYLWHPVFVVIIAQQLGTGWLGLISYLFISFFAGIFFTLLIEEPALKLRRNYLSKKA